MILLTRGHKKGSPRPQAMAYAYLCKAPHPRKYQAKTLDTLLADNGSHYDVS